MTLQEKLAKDFIDAMKQKDNVRKSTISFVRAAIKQYEKDNQKDADEEIVTNIITKQVKMRKDALSDFEKAGRKDLYEAYKDEIEVLNEYLPEQMSEEDISKAIDEAMKELDIKGGKQNMGKLMGAVMAKVKGKADGNVVKKLVNEKLSD